MASASKNIFWLSVSRISALILLFVAYAGLLRYFGPHTFGQYQFVLSYVTIFGVIIDFGLQQYIIKQMSERPTEVKKFFHNFLAVEVVLAAVIYASMVGIAWLGNYGQEVFYAIAVAGIGTALNGLSYPFLSVMSAYYDLKKVAFINFLNSLINASLIFSVIFFHKGIVLLALGQVIFAVVGLLIYYHFVKKHIPKPDVLSAYKSLDKPLLRQIFFAAFPFAMLVGFSTIYNRIDVVLITKMLGYTQAGLYTSAYKFFDLIGFFPAVVSHSLYPLLAAYMARKEIGSVRTTLEKYLRFLLALSLPMGVGGMLLARPVITLLAGPQFADAAPVLAILIWAPVALFIYIVANSLVISQLTRFAVMITGANVAINIIGNILLLPVIGIKGAAIMTVVSECLQGLFYFVFIRRRITPVRFFPYFWRPAVASLVMGVVLWYIRDFALASDSGYGAEIVNLAFWVAAGGIVYLITLFLFQFFHKDDLTFIKNFIRPNQTAAAGNGVRNV